LSSEGAMKYRTLDEIRQSGPLYQDSDLKMSRRARLERWAALLEQHPEPVSVLHETEYQPRPVRDTMRADGSALAVAFQDPLLRVQGLTGDTYGEAVRFFGLSDSEAHHILCYCHYCMTAVPASQTAARVRAIAGRPSIAAIRSLTWIAGTCAGLVALGAVALTL